MRRIASCLLILSLTSCPGLGEVLRLYGYTEIQPASTFFSPGTVVAVDKWKPFRARVLCRAENALGSDFKPMYSRTSNSDIVRARKKSITFETEVMNLVKADSRLSDVSSIKVTLTNAAIYETNDMDVLERMSRNTSEQRSCVRSIQRSLAKGESVTFIVSALQADVTYSVEWNKSSELSAEARVAALQNLAIKLSADNSNVGDDKIDAKGLYLGIRDDESFIQDFDPGKFQGDRLKRGSRLIPVEEVPEIVSRFSSGETIPDMPQGDSAYAPGSPRWTSDQPAYAEPPSPGTLATEATPSISKRTSSANGVRGSANPYRKSAAARAGANAQASRTSGMPDLRSMQQNPQAFAPDGSEVTEELSVGAWPTSQNDGDQAADPTDSEDENGAGSAANVVDPTQTTWQNDDAATQGYDHDVTDDESAASSQGLMPQAPAHSSVTIVPTTPVVVSESRSGHGRRDSGRTAGATHVDVTSDYAHPGQNSSITDGSGAQSDKHKSSVRPDGPAKASAQRRPMTELPKDWADGIFPKKASYRDSAPPKAPTWAEAAPEDNDAANSSKTVANPESAQPVSTSQVQAHPRASRGPRPVTQLGDNVASDGKRHGSYRDSAPAKASSWAEAQQPQPAPEAPAKQSSGRQKGSQDEIKSTVEQQPSSHRAQQPRGPRPVTQLPKNRGPQTERPSSMGPGGAGYI